MHDGVEISPGYYTFEPKITSHQEYYFKLGITAGGKMHVPDGDLMSLKITCGGINSTAEPDTFTLDATNVYNI